jgi:glutamine amidotransferase
MSQDIVIVDYGMGNIGSMQNMFRRLGMHVDVSNEPRRIEQATKLILPGVGAFDAAMSRIAELGIGPQLKRRALRDKVPLLGVCLGMQLLVDGSEEGKLAGLGLIPGKAVRFPPADGLKIPHMGWNEVLHVNACPLTANLGDDARFYFVHSYHVAVDNREHAVLNATYGLTFDAAIQRDNIFGAQFHPEKSHKFGLTFLRAFLEL